MISGQALLTLSRLLVGHEGKDIIINAKTGPGKVIG